MTKRVYDNPSHHCYGPVRRMWMMLVQLDLLKLDDHFTVTHEFQWDEYLALKIGISVSEPEAQRDILRMFFDVESLQ